MSCPHGVPGVVRNWKQSSTVSNAYSGVGPRDEVLGVVRVSEGRGKMQRRSNVSDDVQLVVRMESERGGASFLRTKLSHDVRRRKSLWVITSG